MTVVIPQLVELDSIPEWKKSLLKRRRSSRSPSLTTGSDRPPYRNVPDPVFDKRGSDLQAALASRPLNGSRRTADIIKFFNETLGGGPAVTQPSSNKNKPSSVQDRHLAANCSINKAGHMSGRGGVSGMGRWGGEVDEEERGSGQQSRDNDECEWGEGDGLFYYLPQNRAHPGGQGGDASHQQIQSNSRIWVEHIRHEPVVVHESHNDDEPVSELSAGAEVVLVKPEAVTLGDYSDVSGEPSPTIVVASETERRSENRYVAPARNDEGMGEDKRLFLSNVRRYDGGSAAAFNGAGSRLNRASVSASVVGHRAAGQPLSGRRVANGGGKPTANESGLLIAGPADSDGMLGSGGESDSSEELHYGPGFVSRLKSRYMSVALRGSSRGGATLRRTASLEDFLELDKGAVDGPTVEGVDGARESNSDIGYRPPPQEERRSRRRFREPLETTTVSTSKLSDGTKASRRRESMKRAQSVEVLSALVDSSGKPASRGGTGRGSVLLPDSFFSVEQSSGPPSEEPPPLPPRGVAGDAPPPVNHLLASVPALVKDGIVIKDRPAAKPSQAKSKSSTAAPEPPHAATRAAPNTKRSTLTTSTGRDKAKTSMKRPSSGVLFGVTEKELPAPDTVKETRKLFESNGLSASQTRVKFTPYTTASGGLTKAKSMSSLYTKPAKPAFGAAGRSAAAAGGGQQASSEDLRRVGQPLAGPIPTKTSVLRQNLNNSARPASLYSKLGTSSSPVGRPALPAKPSHLTPIVNGRNSTAHQGGRGAEAHGRRNFKNASSADSTSARGDSYKPSDLQAIRLNLTPVGDRIQQQMDSLTDSSDRDEEDRDDVEDYGDDDADEDDDDEAFKRISDKSRQNIRRDGSVISFNFNNSDNEKKAYLPGPANSKGSPVKQVGVIKPLTRNAASSSHLNNKAEKETIVVEKTPIKPWENTQVGGKAVGPSATNTVISAAPQPPPRNGSRLESTGPPPPRHNQTVATPAAKTTLQRDSLEIKLASEPPADADVTDKAAKTTTTTAAKGAGGGGSYRDGWKARQDQANSLVFNFTNVKKDVSHIENDGLDLTKRAPKKGVLFLATNGESCDGSSEYDEAPEEDDVSATNFIFVGADIKTGKSSIRSKTSSRKLNIKFSENTEVFEYPSYESSKQEEPEEIEQPSNQLKTNTRIGASPGGLGSYTPSKIQLTETPFQLGVSRTPVVTPTAASPSQDIPPPSPAGSDPFLLPDDQGLSWGSTATSDLLF